MARHYHIIGIGGAGMSAMAHILLDRGARVSGSDLSDGASLEALAARGASVRVGHDAAAVAGADLVMTTSAAASDHVEIRAAHAAGIPVLKRADVWREWSAERRVVAVAGTHGKTTTTALLTLMLRAAGQQPGYLIGAEVPGLARPAAWGDPMAPLVLEADEYDRAFLALTPDVAVVTTVEWDHVDIYPDQADYAAAFARFAAATPANRLIVCGDDPGAAALAHDPATLLVGIDEWLARDPVSCRRAPLDWAASGVRHAGDVTHFDVWRHDRRLLATRHAGSVTTQLAGLHHVRNALCAMAAATVLGAPRAAIDAVLASFAGARRRFDHRGTAGGVLVIDDYAHHPAEVRATLAAARARCPERRIVAYIQPHTFSRTRALLDQWAGAADEADVVYVGAIYAAREHDDGAVSAADLVHRLGHRRAHLAGTVAEATALIAAALAPGDVLLTMGAGDGWKIGEAILRQRGQP
jgi:UDP-N-acetylmuramate--alanine ligase